MAQERARKATFLQAARAVFWSFFGVRKRTDYDRDALQLTLGQVIVAGVIGAVLFVATLLGVVYWVMR